MSYFTYTFYFLSTKEIIKNSKIAYSKACTTKIFNSLFSKSDSSFNETDFWIIPNPLHLK